MGASADGGAVLIDVHEFFRASSTACTGDTEILILDVRPSKQYKKDHVCLAFCVRASSNGEALVDYSQANYTRKWCKGLWVQRHVLVYGDDSVRADHPAVRFLCADGRCHRVSVLREGIAGLRDTYPFILTNSTKTSSYTQYPSQIQPGPGGLYLGHWNHAASDAILRNLNIKTLVTIHNEPENLKPARKVRHLKYGLADVESADISKHFDEVYRAIEDTNEKGAGSTLIHCGAGVSRSATLVAAYLMRKERCGAQYALSRLQACRSIVCPNDGFVRTLCALEGSLGLTSRSDADALTRGGGGDEDAPPVAVDAAGAKLVVESSRPSAADSPRRRSRSPAGGARKRARTGPADPPSVVLEVLKGGECIEELKVKELVPHQQCVLGSAPTASIILQHASISRSHAQIHLDGGGKLHVTDLGSKHGTNVDGTWIKQRKVTPVGVGSVVKFGHSTRTYRVAAINVASVGNL